MRDNYDWKSLGASMRITDPEIVNEFKEELKRCDGDNEKASLNFLRGRLKAWFRSIDKSPSSKPDS